MLEIFYVMFELLGFFVFISSYTNIFKLAKEQRILFAFVAVVLFAMLAFEAFSIQPYGFVNSALSSTSVLGGGNSGIDLYETYYNSTDGHVWLQNWHDATGSSVHSLEWSEDLTPDAVRISSSPLDLVVLNLFFFLVSILNIIFLAFMQAAQGESSALESEGHREM